jgi:hypothetical protein
VLVLLPMAWFLGRRLWRMWWAYNDALNGRDN